MIWCPKAQYRKSLPLFGQCPRSWAISAVFGPFHHLFVASRFFQHDLLLPALEMVDHLLAPSSSS